MSIKTVTIGELVRNRRTGEIYIVVDKNDVAVFVASLMRSETPSTALLILNRDMELWIRDCDIDKIKEWERDTFSQNPYSL